MTVERSAVSERTMLERIIEALRRDYGFTEGFLGDIKIRVEARYGGVAHTEIKCKPGINAPEFGDILQLPGSKKPVR